MAQLIDTMKGAGMRAMLGKCLAVTALAVCLVGAGATVAYADTVVTVKPKKGADAYKAIQKELDKARKKASSKNKYTIKVKKGSYRLSHHLSIYSNTTLDLSGVKLKATKRGGHMIKVGASSKDNKKGYAYKNITIKGGDLNNNGNKATAVLVAHAKNVKLQGMKVHNSKDAHLMEVAGVNGLTVEKCKFYDQKQNKKAKVLTLEAIQLDILVNTHMKQYRSEVLPTKNVTIKSCSFNNVPRAVGSHTAFLNSYTTNVKILNNTFTNCKSSAIQTRGYTNCLIEGNTIKSTPRGIVVETISDTGTYLASTAVKEGKVKSKVSRKYKKPVANQNIVVRNNTISVKGADPFFSRVENEGIRVAGCRLKKALKKTSQTDAVPKGNYYASGVTIEGNNITTAAHGIRLDETRNSTVSNNTLSFNGNSKKAKTGFYGIQLLNNSTGNVIKGNTASRFCTHGIVVSAGSSAANIEGNSVNYAGSYGIVVLESKASRITGNRVLNAGVIGIYIMNGGSAGAIEGNTVSAVSKGSAISVYNGSSADRIANNALANLSANGIMVHQKSRVGSITGNTITRAGKYGIYVDEGSQAKAVTGNTIVSAYRDIVIK
ncbi:right-handed parallel beta-helix repeat-containing protein [Adlercreutzia caecimuris]|uniref:right-handed parallel beta-helix repeat-containing protein n=1 Tax=Adlercreutzia caecimuris TaxID=671266 RepID=UPI00249438FB|nr:right-handed parallel beta-helix repeat-containing protein [Adlercreutzia caecimuris]